MCDQFKLLVTSAHWGTPEPSTFVWWALFLWLICTVGKNLSYRQRCAWVLIRTVPKAGPPSWISLTRHDGRHQSKWTIEHKHRRKLSKLLTLFFFLWLHISWMGHLDFGLENQLGRPQSWENLILHLRCISKCVVKVFCLWLVAWWLNTISLLSFSILIKFERVLVCRLAYHRPAFFS